MGDPETQVVMPRIKSDLVDAMVAAADGTLDKIEFELDPRTAATVVMVAGGYPGSYPKGDVINGLDALLEDSIVFHAGTKANNGKIVTNGGRVLAVTGIGQNMQEALDKSYHLASKIEWENVYFRKDIGQDLVALE
jgi:phosphoribosylamine--glycine ligase